MIKKFDTGSCIIEEFGGGRDILVEGNSFHVLPQNRCN